MSYTPKQIPTSGIWDSIKDAASSAVNTAGGLIKKGLTGPTTSNTTYITPPTPAFNYTPLLLIGGGVAVALYLLNKRK